MVQRPKIIIIVEVVVSAEDLLSPAPEPQVSKRCSHQGPEDEITYAAHPGTPNFVTVLLDVSYKFATEL